MITADIIGIWAEAWGVWIVCFIHTHFWSGVCNAIGMRNFYQTTFLRCNIGRWYPSILRQACGKVIILLWVIYSSNICSCRQYVANPHVLLLSLSAGYLIKTSPYYPIFTVIISGRTALYNSSVGVRTPGVCFWREVVWMFIETVPYPLWCQRWATLHTCWPIKNLSLLNKTNHESPLCARFHRVHSHSDPGPCDHLRIVLSNIIIMVLL